jgi:hypothetical protein
MIALDRIFGDFFLKGFLECHHADRNQGVNVMIFKKFAEKIGRKYRRF